MDYIKIGDISMARWMTYQEVVERFGLPSELNIYGSGMSNSLITRPIIETFRNENMIQ